MAWNRNQGSGTLMISIYYTCIRIMHKAGTLVFLVLTLATLHSSETVFPAWADFALSMNDNVTM